MPEPNQTPPRKRGGNSHHRPNCHCAACQRSAKAIPGPTGDGGDALAATAIVQALTEPSADSVALKPVAVTPPSRYKTKNALEALMADVKKPILIQDENSFRSQIAKYAAYRIEGYTTNKEIAELMGVDKRTLAGWVQKAAREGMLKFDDPLERFENEIVPHVVDNIAAFIKAKDRTMTIEAAKGAGIFRSHAVVKNESDMPQTVLALKIEHLDGTPKVLTGHIVGRPRDMKEGE